MQNKKILIITLLMIFIILIIIPNISLAKDIVVMLDPGHGGEDAGTCWGYLKEKDINWKIATKVKEILDATPGITGIMTRREEECPSLYERGVAAKEYNADLLVSFHINSNTIANSARGAEVYITGDRTEERFHNSSNILGKNILANLNSIGIPSFWYEPKVKYSTDGELYANGTLSDYYGIIRNPMYYGIPGVLIEHCFMNNTQDRENFLSNDNDIYEMAVQDANAIINNMELFRKEYKGDIASEITDLGLKKNAQGMTYLQGEIIVTEWINGTTWSIPKELPKIRIKEVNGEESYEMWVAQIEGNTYYFDGYLEGINPNKKYKIEVESGSNENTSLYRLATGHYNSSNTLGIYVRYELKIEESVLVFEPINYYGDIATQMLKTSLKRNEQGRPYIAGEILITEWIGTLWTIPDVMPEITMISTDNSSEQQFWVNNIESNRYYFDGYIDGLDMTKEYVIQIKLKNTYNISRNQQTNAIYKNDMILGNYDNKEIIIEGSKIIFDLGTYQGDIANEITNLELRQNEQGKTYLKGEIIVTEWIDGVTWSIPKETPKMRIKEINGEESYEFWVLNIGENKYYFDGYIEGIDIQKEYEIEVESGKSNNISKYRKVRGVYNKNKELGIYKEAKVKVEESKIVFNLETYQGDIANEITNLELKQNEQGKTYLQGEIVVTEWINGVTWSIPKETPKIRMKEINGEESYEFWVINIGGNRYYFDGYIEGINVQNEYEIEVESGSRKNISKYRKTKGIYNKERELGIYKDNKVKIESNIIRFINISKEIMTIESNTEILQDEKDTNIETFSVNNEGKIIVEEQKLEQNEDIKKE